MEATLRRALISVALFVSSAAAVYAQGGEGVRGNDNPRTVRAPEKTVDSERHSQDVKENIELFQERIQRKLQKIDTILKGLDLRKVEAQKVTVEALREILDDLDSEAKAILEADSQVRPDLKLYRKALLAAPEVFRSIADGFDKRAETAKSKQIREGYLDFAMEARKHADSYTQRAKDVEGMEAAIEKQLEFVTESRDFILEVNGFLAAVPTSSGIETQKFVARINEYISAFESAISAIKKVSDKISEQPRTPTPDPDAKKKASPRQAQGGTVMSDDEYRTRVAALKR